MRGLALLLLSALLAQGCAVENSSIDAASETLRDRAQRRDVARGIRDAARARGMSNPLVLAGIAQAETNLSHCRSHFAPKACNGPASADCGGGPVLAGGGDGPCLLRRGGLGLFQFDAGNFDDTLRREGNGILTIAGNTDAGVDFVINMVRNSAFIAGVDTDAQALEWINALRIDDFNWRSWVETVTTYYNGCSRSRCRRFSERYARYDRGSRELINELGADFWYGDAAPVESPPPLPTVGGFLASPLPEAIAVTSFYTHRNGGAKTDYRCRPVRRGRHSGTDFAAAVGTPVRASAAGTVLRVKDGCGRGGRSSRCGGGFGNHVILLHDDGFATLYAHLKSRSGLPRVGARIGCGDLLGQSGNSGRSTGPHLHFELRSGVADIHSYFSATRLDPFGGACSQARSFWLSGEPQAACSSEEPPSTGRDDSAFVNAKEAQQVIAQPGQRIIQRWTLRNTGTRPWSTAGGYAFTAIGGDTLSAPGELPLRGDGEIVPGATATFALPVVVPMEPGTYRSDWQMTQPEGNFGDTVFLAIVVEAPPPEPSGCQSRTLGSEVPHLDCVQVDYPSGGADRCGWFQCVDGNWRSTPLDSCGGGTNPHPSCGAALGCESRTLERTVDSGVCVQVDYGACGTDSCGWFACNDGAWGCTDISGCEGEQVPHGSCGGVEDELASCDSKTLGQTVQSGACVQVAYEACGAGECGWFGCNDGGWQCTDVSSCAGDNFANPRCPADCRAFADCGSCAGANGCSWCADVGCMPTADTASCAVAVNDAPGCDDCRVNTNCADCIAQSGCAFCGDEGGRSCIDTGRTTCESELVDAGGCDTLCSQREEPCTGSGVGFDDECCADLICVAGACVDPIGGREGAACADAGECALGLACRSVSVDTAPSTCCARDTDYCERKEDCCGLMDCTGNRCVGRNPGEACILGDCRGASSCNAGTCG